MSPHAKAPAVSYEVTEQPPRDRQAAKVYYGHRNLYSPASHGGGLSHLHRVFTTALPASSLIAASRKIALSSGSARLKFPRLSPGRRRASQQNLFGSRCRSKLPLQLAAAPGALHFARTHRGVAPCHRGPSHARPRPDCAHPRRDGRLAGRTLSTEPIVKALPVARDAAAARKAAGGAAGVLQQRLRRPERPRASRC